MKILVVEDEILLKDNYEKIISDYIPGIRVDWAISVSMAKKLLDDNHYDISFLDVRLNDRGQSGLTVIPHLLNKDTMVIVLSGISEAKIKTRAILRGAKGYVVKSGKDSVIEACKIAVYNYSKKIADVFFHEFYKHTPEIEANTIEIIESYITDKKTFYLIKGQMADKYVKKLYSILKKHISLKRERYIGTQTNEGVSSYKEIFISEQTSKDFANIVLSRLKEKNVALQNVVYDMLTQYEWEGGEKEAIKLSDSLLKKWKRMVPLKGLPEKYKVKEDNKLDIKLSNIPQEMEDLIIKHGWPLGMRMIRKMMMIHMFNKFDRSYTITGQKINITRKSVWTEINGGGYFEL